MYLKKLFSSCKIFNILFVNFIISIYLLHSTNSYSQEDSTNNTPQQEVTINGVKYSPTTPTNNNPQEVTINGFTYTQTSPQNNTTPQNNPNTPNPTPPAKTQATQSTLKISDLIVGGYVSAGYLFNLGSMSRSFMSFQGYIDYPCINYCNSATVSTKSTSGDAFYVKLGYQSIMFGLELELKSKSELSNIIYLPKPEYNYIISNYSPEIGFNFYFDFLSSKKYLLAPVFGVAFSQSSIQTLSNNQIYKDKSSPNTALKYGVLYRQFVYKNIGLEVSWYGMSRWSKHDVTGWSYINGGYVETTYNSSEFSIGIVYDF